ncbi:MAG: hypothetical protein EAZ30_01340 [Betaproteobacteria bacterium]|nr:MAG: hypothetical protein EAZ30_01340 [Betaproteobacteria bacterium]
MITEQEWRHAVASRDDLEWYDQVGTKADGGVRVLGIADEEDAAIWWQPRDGSIQTKNPRGELLSRMVEIARELDAVVMGDEGETYHLPDRINVPIPFLDVPENTANVWQMPTPELIDELDRQHAAWRAQIANVPPVSSTDAKPKRDRSVWAVIGAVAFVIWLLWKAFGSPT